MESASDSVQVLAQGEGFDVFDLHIYILRSNAFVIGFVGHIRTHRLCGLNENIILVAN